MQTLLAKKDLERALAALKEGLAYSPADKALMAMAAVALEQAETRAADERKKAVARGASAQVKFRQADRTVQNARQLSRGRKPADSASAYLEAANLFATTAPAFGAGRGAAEAPADEPSAAADPDPPPAPAKQPEPVRSVPKAPVDPVVELFVSALSRGDRAAVLAVYPSAPADVLSILGKRSQGSTVRPTDIRSVRDSRGWPEAVVTIETVSASGAREGQLQQLVLGFEPAGETWKVNSSRLR